MKITNTVKLNVLLGIVAALTTLLLAWWLARSCSNNRISLEIDKGIDITPEQIQSIRDIGQWEFLAVNNEELIDTVRKGIFSDDHLVRIYYGTLRLGVDLKTAPEGWISMKEDTVIVKMPQIKLLDEHFIDEARTQAFHESGRWSARDRDALYRKADRMMRQHCLTPKNFEIARQNGIAQMTMMLKAMGFENVNVTLE